MKKTIFAILAFMLVFSLVACEKTSTTANVNSTENSESSSTNNTQDTPQSSSESKTTPVAIGENAKIGDWEITVTDVTYVDQIKDTYMSFKPNEDGGKYAQVSVSVTNNGKSSNTFLPSFGLNKDIRAKVLFKDYEFSSSVLLGHSQEIHNEVINPLGNIKGIIAFEIPAAAASSTEELLLNFSMGSEKINFKIR